MHGRAGPHRGAKRVRELQLDSVTEYENITMEDYFLLGLDNPGAAGADPCSSPALGPSTPEPVGGITFHKSRWVSPKPAEASAPNVVRCSTRRSKGLPSLLALNFAMKMSTISEDKRPYSLLLLNSA